jgi:hypothetical protein
MKPLLQLVLRRSKGNGHYIITNKGCGRRQELPNVVAYFAVFDSASPIIFTKKIFNHS